jgi:penicillin-binding protein
MQEEHQSSPPKSSGWRTFGLVTFITVKWIIYFGIFIGLLAGGALTGYVAALVKGEEIRPLTVIEEKVGENAITGFVYFNDETLVGQLRTSEDRMIITYDDLPPQVINAVLGIEDNNFFEHNGVDINGLGRAIKQKLLNEDTQTGGSTLTQQLARRVFLSLDKTDSRKIKEIFLSLRMERYLTKEEILTAYLNKVPFGNGSTGYNMFGIKAAAKGVFNITDLNQLNLAQAAYLAGLPQRPSAYTAFTGKGEFNEDGFKLAMGRLKTVLMRMYETGRITKQEYDEALAFDIRSTLAEPSEKAYTTYPYLMLEAERQAAEVLLLQQDPALTKEDLRKKENAGLIEEARDQLQRGGYHVYTTIDKDIYKLMREIGSNAENFSPYSEEKGLEQIAAIMLDHRTGAILGMLEGRDFYEEQLNYATQMTRQPGSTMKTLAAYLPAIEMGIIQPASIIDDAPIVMKDGQKGFHIPMNVNRKFAGLVTAREALNRSLNLPALKIFNEEVKIENAWDFVRKLGITTLQPEDAYSQTGVIGGLRIGVSVEELTNAYGAIPNKGVFNDSFMIQRITDANGKIVYEHKMEPKQVFSEQSAFLMTDMLRTVISDRSGSGNKLTSQFDKYGKIPIAGKTGSTQSYGDVWFMGFTPEVTLGVWSGYEEQINSLSEAGKARARSIWALIMNKVTDVKPELFVAKEFERPEGIVKATVSSASGLLPSQVTKSAGMLVTDWFNKKDIPKQTDDTLVNMSIITYNGVNYIPNPATPADMLQQKVLIKRKKPLDALMEEIEAAQAKLPASSRRAMSVYLPADAANNAPSKTDPRADDGAAPAPPASSKLAATGGDSLTITFSASPSSDVVGYRLYRSVNQGAYEKVGASILTGGSYSFPVQVSGGASYSYYVAAVDVVGHESSGNQVLPYGMTLPTVPDTSATPGDSGQGGAEASETPASPTGVKVQKTDLSVRLTWSANAAADQVKQYHIYYSPGNDGQYSRIASTTDTRFEYVAPLITGAFFVSAENAKGESNPSAMVSVD